MKIKHNPNYQQAFGQNNRADVKATRKLISDPVGWLSKRFMGEIKILPNARFTFEEEELNPTDEFQPGDAVDSFVFPSDFTFDAVVTSNGGLFFYSNPVQEESGVRALPYLKDKCTYMQLPATARFWATGPLSGCHVYTAGDKKAPWVFHANANNDDNNLQDNMSAKRKLALNIVTRLPNVQCLSSGLERNEYSTKGFGGFVFGTNGANGWRFYTYLANPANRHWKIVPLM